MKILAYISSLLPTFERERVLEDCRMTRAEIKSSTLPAYVGAEKLLRGYKLKSKNLIDKEAVFGRIYSHSNAPLVTAVVKGLNQTHDNLDHLELQLKKTLSEEVSAAGITYLKANLVQLCEAAAFVSKYAIRFLDYIYVLETAEIPDSGTYIQKTFAPAEIAWIEDNFLSFCTALNAVATPTDQLARALATIPDIVVTKGNATTLPVTMGESKLDPFQMRLIGTPMAPIYHVAMFVAEWQANRYKASEEELKLCELRKLNLERLLENKPDARIQKVLEVTESRVHDLRVKLAKLELDYV